MQSQGTHSENACKMAAPMPTLPSENEAKADEPLSQKSNQVKLVPKEKIVKTAKILNFNEEE